MGRRCIGLDVHREFAQVAVWEDGVVRQAGQIALTDEALRVFADSLGPEDEVAIEATCNTQAIVRLIEPHVARVVVSNPQKTRAIAEAKVKTDKVDAEVLGAAVGGRLSAVGVGRRSGHPGAAPTGRPPRAHRPAADPAEEPGAGDPSPQPDPAVPGGGPVRDQGPLLAGRSAAAGR